MADEKLKARQLSHYPFQLEYRTRWSDNDQYSHVNNATYYQLFDAIINAYLIEKCGLQPPQGKTRGLVVKSWCEYFAPLAFPEVLKLGLRVTKLGNSSVSYEVGVFSTADTAKQSVAAVGGYTHVFVDSTSLKSGPIEETIRNGLQKLIRDQSKL